MDSSRVVEKADQLVQPLVDLLDYYWDGHLDIAWAERMDTK